MPVAIAARWRMAHDRLRTMTVISHLLHMGSMLNNRHITGIYNLLHARLVVLHVRLIMMCCRSVVLLRSDIHRRLVGAGDHRACDGAEYCAEYRALDSLIAI